MTVVDCTSAMRTHWLAFQVFQVEPHRMVKLEKDPNQLTMSIQTRLRSCIGHKLPARNMASFLHDSMQHASIICKTGKSQQTDLLLHRKTCPVLPSS